MLITDLMLNFQQALREIVPRIEFVGTPWKEPQAYDQWDDIASAIFEALVREPIRSSWPEEQWHLVNIPGYNYWKDGIAGRHFIEVLSDTDPGTICVFDEFSTVSEPFDTVRWFLLSKATGEILKEPPPPEIRQYYSGPVWVVRTGALKDLKFALRSPRGNRWDEGVESVAIPDCFNEGKFL